MALNENFEGIAEADLVSLKANGITEGPLLEFKRGIYGRSDSDKREFLKDLSALANAMGGHLVIGIEEEEGVAGDLVPIAADVDAELLRLENLARDGVQPRIIGLRMRAVPVTAGSVIVVKVPRSLHAPHRVSFQGVNRFYTRNSTGVHELSVDELRVAFIAQATARERAEAYRKERVALISAGEAPLADVDLTQGAAVLHVVPWSALSDGMVDIDVARRMDGPFSPIGRAGYSPRYNFEGFICKEQNIAYTQVFRSGTLEAVTTGLLGGQLGRRGFSGHYLERQLSEGLSRYLPALPVLGVGGPALVGISLLRVAGASVHIGEDSHSFTVFGTDTLRYDRIDLPGVVIEDLSVPLEMKRLLRVPFDTLWNAVGATREHLFDADGNWIGRS